MVRAAVDDPSVLLTSVLVASNVSTTAAPERKVTVTVCVVSVETVLTESAPFSFPIRARNPRNVCPLLALTTCLQLNQNTIQAGKMPAGQPCNWAELRDHRAWVARSSLCSIHLHPKFHSGGSRARFTEHSLMMVMVVSDPHDSLVARGLGTWQTLHEYSFRRRGHGGARVRCICASLTAI